MGTRLRPKAAYSRGTRLSRRALASPKKASLIAAKNSGRQHAVINPRWRSARDRTQIVARPQEVVDFVQDNPRPLAIKTEVRFHSWRNLHRQSRISWRRVRYGQDINSPSIVRFRRDQDDDGRSILSAFLSTFVEFSPPQIGVPQDEPRFGRPELHLSLRAARLGDRARPRPAPPGSSPIPRRSVR